MKGRSRAGGEMGLRRGTCILEILILVKHDFKE